MTPLFSIWVGIAIGAGSTPNSSDINDVVVLVDELEATQSISFTRHCFENRCISINRSKFDNDGILEFTFGNQSRIHSIFVPQASSNAEIDIRFDSNSQKFVARIRYGEVHESCGLRNQLSIVMDRSPNIESRMFVSCHFQDLR